MSCISSSRILHHASFFLLQLHQHARQLQQSPLVLQQQSQLQNPKRSLLKPAPLPQSNMRIAAAILNNRLNPADVYRSQFLSTRPNAANSFIRRLTSGARVPGTFKVRKRTF
jgi:hypothetical protein